MLIMLVHLQVFHKVIDSFSKQRYLHFGRARIAGMKAEFFYYFLLLLFIQGHFLSLLRKLKI